MSAHWVRARRGSAGGRRGWGVWGRWTLGAGPSSAGEAVGPGPVKAGLGAAPHHVAPPGANPCEHKGKCLNTQGSFECRCLQGYTGPRCEIDVNECVSNPCQNDATCLDQIGEFQCICMPGAWGPPGETGSGQRARSSAPSGQRALPASGETEGGRWAADQARELWASLPGRRPLTAPALPSLPPRLRGCALRGEQRRVCQQPLSAERPLPGQDQRVRLRVPHRCGPGPALAVLPARAEP